jgi:endonuclease/exonuclease/phosphatase family metal-dependent hydrolase
VVAVISYGVFWAVSISPEKFWLAGFVSYLVPFVLLLNLFFTFFWLFLGKWKAVLSALVLISGARFVKSSIAFGNSHDYAVKSPGDLDVMSYNIKVFNAYASWQNKKEHTGMRIADWIGQEALPDVVCFQEFYQNRREEYLDMVSKMKREGYPYYYFYDVLHDNGGGYFGMAVFSKYKIENKGDIVFKQHSNNMGIYVDINVSGEILRIFNIHLESLSLDEKRMLDIDEESTNVYRKLKDGFKKRAKQIDLVLKEAKHSPHKVIICGDWNDLPYGYSYGTMKKHYDNAFEEAGSGFGFTYNGKMRFLRIDNQFYNKTLEIKKFETFSKVTYSDHFPIMARYHVK